MYLGNIDYSQPKLGFEGLPELERFVNCFEPNTAYSLGLYWTWFWYSSADYQ